MVRDVRIGSKIFLKESDALEMKRSEMVECKVVEMYTHHVIVQSKTGKRRCLCNGTLVMMGLARQGGVYE